MKHLVHWTLETYIIHTFLDSRKKKRKKVLTGQKKTVCHALGPSESGGFLEQSMHWAISVSFYGILPYGFSVITMTINMTCLLSYFRRIWQISSHSELCDIMFYYDCVKYIYWKHCRRTVFQIPSYFNRRR